MSFSDFSWPWTLYTWLEQKIFAPTSRNVMWYPKFSKSQRTLQTHNTTMFVVVCMLVIGLSEVTDLLYLLPTLSVMTIWINLTWHLIFKSFWLLFYCPAVSPFTSSSSTVVLLLSDDSWREERQKVTLGINMTVHTCTAYTYTHTSQCQGVGWGVWGWGEGVLLCVMSGLQKKQNW